MSTLLTCAITVLISVDASCAAAEPTPPKPLISFFQPPERYRNDFGNYKSPLLTANSTSIDSAAGWNQRREELRREWHERLGPWPPLIAAPDSAVESTEVKGGIATSKIRIAAGIDGEPVYGYLLKPAGDGPFPAVLVVYYEPETAAGFGKELRDFGVQLAKRGFVTLSIGPPRVGFLPDGAKPLRARPYYGPIGKSVETQPISALAYAAANCHTYLAQQSYVDDARIGIMGHSFGGKWAMFASCLYDKFASAAWSDAGVVFDERNRNVNYWDRWYLGFKLGEITTEEPGFHFRGIPTEPDRTGTYRQLRAEGRDLVELHSLMAPRPFLVSGGSADREERWSALNHSIAVNRILGQEYGVAMTSRAHHAPTSESNEQIYKFFEWSLRR